MGMGINNIINLITAVVGVIGLYFIWNQYKISNEQIKIANAQTKAMYDQIKSQEALVQREKAVDIAKEFSQMIDNELGFLTDYYDRVKLSNILSGIKNTDMKYFDISEFEELFDADLREKYYKIVLQPNIIELSNAYVLHNCGSKSDIEKIKKYISMNWEIDEKIKKRFNNPDDILKNGSSEDKKSIILEMQFYYSMLQQKDEIIKFYHNSTIKLLNQLEYLCMQFKTGLADEEIVYQSLHQLYLSVVKSLYIVISNTNDKQVDKFYTNIVWLYNVWSERLQTKMQTEKLNKEKIVHNSKYG